MKKALIIIAVFVSGVALASTAIWLAILLPMRRAVWTERAQALEMNANVALQLQLGEQQRFLSDFELILPGEVALVHSFAGDTHDTRRALDKVRAYYRVTGVVVPGEISSILAAVPEQSRDPLARGAANSRSTLPKLGDPCPILSVHSIDNQPIDFSGKVLVLNFFATWCGPCMHEMPHLEKDLWEPLKSKGLLVVAVGREHSEGELKAFRQGKAYSFPFVADPKREIYGKFATDYIPLCVVVGKNGRIKYQSVGFAPEDFATLVKTVKTELDQ